MTLGKKYHQIRILDDGLTYVEPVVCWTQEEVEAAVKRLLEDNCYVFIRREWQAVGGIFIVEGFPETQL